MFETITYLKFNRIQTIIEKIPTKKCKEDIQRVKEFEKFVKACDYERFEYLLKILNKKQLKHTIKMSKQLFDPAKKFQSLQLARVIKKCQKHEGTFKLQNFNTKLLSINDGKFQKQ